MITDKAQGRLLTLSHSDRGPTPRHAEMRPPNVVFCARVD